ncbi:MAG: hypothetical protein RIC37_11115 [Gammaproteobacteria bacterium]
MFEKILNMLKPQRQEQAAKTINEATVENKSGIDRARMVYGEEKINRQKLYEKWACKETWELSTEGIPLLLGLDPGSSGSLDEVTRQARDELWQHASDCVNKKLLAVINHDAQPDEWRVIPSDLYSWAMVSRVPVPQELAALMDFVLQTIKVKHVSAKQDTASTNEKGYDAIYQKHCEITLGAAMSLLANSPEKCQSSRGRVKASLIAAEILNNGDAWFGKDEPLLAQSAMEDLINRYIARARVPVENSGN